ncbi:calcium-binding protein [Actinoplanes sp. NPDC026670]|uniref:calcium-binding protein n=1 Tax=Actinoplanes sp. NPDC026670 TaxID=3154700 RepID=UPI0033DF47CE
MTTVRKTAAGALAVAVGTAAALVTATPARAAGTSWAYVDGNRLTVEAAYGVVNNYYVRSGTGVFHFYDSDGAILLDPARTGGCVPATSSMITCPLSVLVLSVDARDGDDYVQNDTDRRLNVHGGDGNDRILGGGSYDGIHGDAGDDHLEGRGGHDVVYGGAGNDRTWGGDGADIMDGGPGVDEAHGEDGNDTLESADGNDRLLGSFGNDTIQDSRFVDAGWGDDTVNIRHQGTGDIWGDDGYDTLNYTAWTIPVYVSLDGNSNDGSEAAACDDWIGCPVPSAQHNVHGDFERVIGSPNGDRISGNGEPDEIYGGGGNDKLYGNGGDDLLDAQAGTSQTLNGGTGTDTCRGSGTLSKSGCDVL